MALTNPTKGISVRRLNYFYNKLKDIFATKQDKLLVEIDIAATTYEQVKSLVNGNFIPYFKHNGTSGAATYKDVTFIFSGMIEETISGVLVKYITFSRYVYGKTAGTIVLKEDNTVQVIQQDFELEGTAQTVVSSHNSAPLSHRTLFESKQDVITDLETIRTGASKGATAAQPADVATAISTHNTATNAHTDLFDKKQPLYKVVESTSSTVTLAQDTITIISTPSTALSITLPNVTTNKDYFCKIVFKAGASMIFTENAPTACAIQHEGGVTPTFVEGTQYEIEYNCIWVLDDDGNKIIRATVIDGSKAGSINAAKGAGVGANIFNDITHNVASGKYAQAQGNSTTASGKWSHAEGVSTNASADCTHAEGSSTKASSAYQHVQGTYNVEDSASTYADIIGGGTSNSARKNIEATTWTGDKRMKGDVYVQCDDDSTNGKKLLTDAPTDNKQYARKNGSWAEIIGGGGSGVWGGIGGDIDDQTDLQAQFSTKQDYLISGTTIKTFNGQSVLGSGDLFNSLTGLKAFSFYVDEDSHLHAVAASATWQEYQFSVVDNHLHMTYEE